MIGCRLLPAAPPQVSPDGRWIALSQSGFDLVLVDVTGHAQARLLQPGAAVVAWSPDSCCLAYASGIEGTELYLHDIQSNQTERLITIEQEGSEMGIRDVVWSPDGRYIAFACCFASIHSDDRGDLVGEIRRLEVTSRQIETVGTITATIASSSPLCWTADGQLMTTANPTPAARCSDTPRRSPIVISPDGVRVAKLAPISWDGFDWSGPSRLSVVEMATDQLLWQQELTINATTVAWSPDGRYLLLDDDLAHSPIWRIKVGGTDGLEPVLEEGFLLDVLFQWSIQPASGGGF